MVNATLGHTLARCGTHTPDDFDREHLRLLTNKLDENVQTHEENQ